MVVWEASPLKELMTAISGRLFPAVHDFELSALETGFSMQHGSLQEHALSMEPDGAKTVWVRMAPAKGGMQKVSSTACGNNGCDELDPFVVLVFLPDSLLRSSFRRSFVPYGVPSLLVPPVPPDVVYRPVPY
jgi:hypothetical protein